MTVPAAPPRLLVEGNGGLLAGCRRTLSPGHVLVVGRSRTCHLSLRRTKAFAHRDDRDHLLRSARFNRVSRVHCEIEYRRDGSIEIRDLSQNGTLVDGRRIDRVRVLDAARSLRVTVELVDSTWGSLVLSVGQ